MSTTKPKRFQCRHIFTDGHRCGSPALRTQNFCFYHDKARRNGPRQPQVTSSATPHKSARNSTFDLPSPADLAERSGLQLALGHILHKIAHNEIDPRRAGLLLYGLQIASMNLPKDTGKTARYEQQEEPVDEVIDDPELGALAPELQVGHGPDTRSSIRKMVDRLEGRTWPYADEDEDDDLPDPAPLQPHFPESALPEPYASESTSPEPHLSQPAPPEPLSLQAVAAAPRLALPSKPRHLDRSLPIVRGGDTFRLVAAETRKQEAQTARNHNPRCPSALPTTPALRLAPLQLCKYPANS